jgi:hypothetical protein
LPNPKIDQRKNPSKANPTNLPNGQNNQNAQKCGREASKKISKFSLKIKIQIFPFKIEVKIKIQKSAHQRRRAIFPQKAKEFQTQSKVPKTISRFKRISRREITPFEDERLRIQDPESLERLQIANWHKNKIPKFKNFKKFKQKKNSKMQK